MLGARRPTARGAWPLHARAANAVLALELRRRTQRAAARPRPDARRARARRCSRSGIRDRRFGWPLEMVLRAADAGLDDPRGAASPTTRATARSKVTGTVRGHRPRGPRHDESLTVTPESE